MFTDSTASKPNTSLIEESSFSSMSMTEIIETYKAIAIKLSLFADAIPETEAEQKEIADTELRLLDEQAALLEATLSRPISNIDDVKAMLTLWHHEVVQSQSLNSLNAADEIVNSVYTFLKTA